MVPFGPSGPDRSKIKCLAWFFTKVFIYFENNKNFKLLHKFAWKTHSADFNHPVGHFCISQTTTKSSLVSTVQSGPVRASLDSSKPLERDRRSGPNVCSGPFWTGPLRPDFSLSRGHKIKRAAYRSNHVRTGFAFYFLGTLPSKLRSMLISKEIREKERRLLITLNTAC